VKRILTSALVSAAALAVAAWLFAGIRIGGADTTERLVTLAAVALIFGLVNTLVAPVVKLLALPFILVTLGLLLLVINAAMLLLVAWIADWLDVAFAVSGFWTAVGGALVISVVSWALESTLRD